jgi:carbonic anhydrase/acetyltransferase-like protein (isoleucine patch superfamily)
MAIYQLDDAMPRIAASAWVADTACVIGNVVLEEGASVWYGAVLRGDNELIHLGRNANVQDGSVLHTDAGLPLRLADEVTVGHQAMLHGCSIGERTLVAIQAVVLNGARIGRCCVVGAGALVTEGKEFADYSLIVGTPARLARTLTPEQFEAMAGRLAGHYVQQMQRHRAGIRRIG